MSFIPRSMPSLTVRDDDPPPLHPVNYTPDDRPVSPNLRLGIKFYAFGSFALTVCLILWGIYKIYYVQGNPNKKKKLEEAKDDIENQRDRSASVSSEATVVDETAANTAANALIGKAGEKPSLRIVIPSPPPRVKTYPKSHGHRADPQGRYYNAQEAILPPINVRAS